MTNELFKAMELMDEFGALMDKIESKNMLLMLFGVAIDYWAAKHGMDVEESKDMVQTLANLHADVNDSIGMMGVPND